MIMAGNDRFLSKFTLMNKSLKLCLAVSLLVAATTSIHAQIRISQVVGFNFANMDLSTGGSEIEAKGTTGINFGMLFPLQFSDNFALHPGVLFTSLGSSYKTDTIDISISPIYIEIPFNAVLNIGSGVIGIVFSAGTYFSVGVGGNKIISGGEAKDILYGSGDTKDLKHFDFGLNFGAGLNIKGFLISAQYGYGLANLSPETSDVTEMKNRVVGISLTSSFSGR